MAGDDETDQPDMQPNLLKGRKRAAATRADQSVSTLAPAGGNPLSAVLSALEDAWVSPARERRTFAENVEGAGTAVADAFRAQSDHASSEASAEPWKVDADDPYEGWKASAQSIDARASMPYGGY